jgi:hypothetical protein
LRLSSGQLLWSGPSTAAAASGSPTCNSINTFQGLGVTGMEVQRVREALMGNQRPVAPFHLACLLNPRAEGRSWGLDVYSGASSSYRAEQQLAELKDLMSRLERRVSKVEHAAVARSVNVATIKSSGHSSSSNSGYVRVSKTEPPLARARAALLQHLQQVASSPGTAGKQRIPKIIHQVTMLASSC